MHQLDYDGGKAHLLHGSAIIDASVLHLQLELERGEVLPVLYRTRVYRMPDGAACLGDDDVLRLAGDVELDWKWLSEEWSRRKWLISVEGTMNQWLSVVTH